MEDPNCNEASVFLEEIGSAKGGFAYDLYNELVSRIYGGLDFFPHEKVTLGADYEYFVPTFDADSIFNWFSHNPYHTAMGRIAIGPFEGFDMSLGGGARLWLTDGDPTTWAQEQCTFMLSQSGGTPTQEAIQRCIDFGIETGFGGVDADGNPIPSGADAAFTQDEQARSTTIAPDLLGNLGARYDWGNGMVGLDSMVQTGFAYARWPEDASRAERFYADAACLDADDIARAVRYVLCEPPGVEIVSVVIRPKGEH